jgi:hypothetical protein
MVPDRKRLKGDFEWLSKNMIKLQERYAGMFVAVIDKRVAGRGKTAVEAYNKAKRNNPKKEPLMDLVPSKEFLLL